jgi:hypothetical protein
MTRLRRPVQQACRWLRARHARRTSQAGMKHTAVCSPSMSYATRPEFESSSGKLAALLLFSVNALSQNGSTKECVHTAKINTNPHLERTCGSRVPRATECCRDPCGSRTGRQRTGRCSNEFISESHTNRPYLRCQGASAITFPPHFHSNSCHPAWPRVPPDH